MNESVYKAAMDQLKQVQLHYEKNYHCTCFRFVKGVALFLLVINDNGGYLIREFTPQPFNCNLRMQINEDGTIDSKVTVPSFSVNTKSLKSIVTYLADLDIVADEIKEQLRKSLNIKLIDD
jgi:hypothetical protein|nr:MAG TPA: hypothetical protein [Caudoviricetes sp.]